MLQVQWRFWHYKKIYGGAGVNNVPRKNKAEWNGKNKSNMFVLMQLFVDEVFLNFLS